MAKFGLPYQARKFLDELSQIFQLLAIFRRNFTKNRQNLLKNPGLMSYAPDEYPCTKIYRISNFAEEV